MANSGQEAANRKAQRATTQRTVRRGSGRQTARTPDPTKNRGNSRTRKGVPGVDFSGVHPETGKYTVVRGNYEGVAGERMARRIGSNKYDTYKKGEINPRAPKTPMDKKRKNNKICGAQRTGKSSAGPGICCQTAGWGTAHPGYGHCRNHGGLLESHEKAAEIQKATDMTEMYGTPITGMDPHEALAQEVSRSAGHVQWLQSVINKFDDKKELTQWSEATGVSPSVWIDLYHKERDRLVASSKAALQAGVAERTVRVAEEQGRLFAMVITRIFSDPRLSITNAQKAVMPAVVRDHMMALDAGDLEIEEAEVVEVGGSGQLSDNPRLQHQART